MTKTLPCRVCGKPIDIPAKYARAKSAVHPECERKANAFAKVVDSVFRVLTICFWGTLGTLLVWSIINTPSFRERCAKAGGSTVGSLENAVCVKRGVRFNP